jgi:hypothetical protein
MLRRFTSFAVSMLLLFTPLLWHTSAAFATPADGKDVVLKASDMKPKFFPETVFFRGQTAPVQMRNAGGVHFGDDAYVLAGMVDNSGYSSGLRQKYQAYLLTEVPLQIGGQTVKPGAYGFGFLEGGKFVVLDLGANELVQVPSQRDGEMKRPTPFQIVTASEAAKYRLYMGREFVEFSRMK